MADAPDPRSAENETSPGVGSGELWWGWWPRLDYGRGLALQQRLHGARRRGAIPDSMVVTEHLPTVTLGRRGSLADLLLGPSALAARGIALYRVGRGGRATFHGPGQLVAYPIVDLRGTRLGVRRFVHALEEALARVVGGMGIAAEPGRRDPGLWVGDRKIGAVGIEIVAGVSRHGIALNLGNDLSGFGYIVPCGLPQCLATSAGALGVKAADTRTAGGMFAGALATLLGLRPRELEPRRMEQMASSGSIIT